MFAGLTAALFGFMCLSLAAANMKARPALEGKRKVGRARRAGS